MVESKQILWLFMWGKRTLAHAWRALLPHWWFVPHCHCPFFSRTNLPSFISNLPELACFGSHNLSTVQCLRYLIITNQGHYVFAVHCASISVNMSTLWAIKHSKIIFTASFLPFKDNCLVFHVFLNSLFSVTSAWVCSYHHPQPWFAE